MSALINNISLTKGLLNIVFDISKNIKENDILYNMFEKCAEGYKYDLVHYQCIESGEIVAFLDIIHRLLNARGLLIMSIVNRTSLYIDTVDKMTSAVQTVGDGDNIFMNNMIYYNKNNTLEFTLSVLNGYVNKYKKYKLVNEYYKLNVDTKENDIIIFLQAV